MHLPLPSYLPPKRSGQRSASFRHLFHTTSRFAQVTYDLTQVDPALLFPLRDTIIAALEHFKDGPRAIILQLCLALAGLALQLPTWTNAVEGLIDSYGQNPSMVPVLLQFLTVLPEELYSNTKIPVTVGWTRRNFTGARC
jgi:transportin-3